MYEIARIVNSKNSSFGNIWKFWTEKKEFSEKNPYMGQ